MFQKSYTPIKTQFLAKIVFRSSDNGLEFLNNTLCDLLSSKGIVYQSSCAYTPQQKEVVERKNCHLLEVAWSFCFLLHFHHAYGGMQFSIQLILLIEYLNMSSNSKPFLNSSKSHTLPRGLFSMSSLQVFECTTFVHSHGPNQTKFTHAQKCVFAGYPLHQRGYKCFHLSSQKYVISMDVIFLEDQPFSHVSHLHEKIQVKRSIGPRL